MQILVYFRRDSRCIAITWQPLVGTGGLNYLLAASHLKDEPDWILSSFSNAVLCWYGVEADDHAVGLLFHLEGVSLPDENGVFLYDPFSSVCSVLLISPGLYWNGISRSTWLTGLRGAIPLRYNLAMSREGQMFIQTISSVVKPQPTTLLFWKGVDVFILSDTAKTQIEVVSLPFAAVSCDPLGETLCQRNCKCNCYVITVFIKYEHNMTEFILKSLTSQCRRHAPCAGSRLANRRLLLQNWSLANIPVFVLGREAWTELYGKRRSIGLKKSHWLRMFSHDVMIHLYWQSHLHWHGAFQV